MEEHVRRTLQLIKCQEAMNFSPLINADVRR
jgi:hypothetical protein